VAIRDWDDEQAEAALGMLYLLRKMGVVPLQWWAWNAACIQTRGI